MTSHRTLTTTALLLALPLAAATPAAANPILGGYGGPGMGSQVILGSALFGAPPAGGGGAPGASAGPGTGASEGATGALAAASAPVNVAPGTHTGGAARGPSGAASGSQQTGLQATAYAAAGAGSQPLGLTGTDLAYVLAVLAALVATGVITTRLARQPR